jgi:uncharacterized protein
MRRYFVDTGFWIALVATLDQGYERAFEFARSLTGSDELITSDFVIIEFLNYFSERGIRARNRAAAFVKDLELNTRIQIVPLSSSLYRKGREKFERYADKDWSLIDCTSFVIMEDIGLVNALTFDHHFKQAGFQSPLS